MLVAATAFIWLSLPGSVRATFGIAEKATLVAIFAAVLVALGLGVLDFGSLFG